VWALAFCCGQLRLLKQRLLGSFSDQRVGAGQHVFLSLIAKYFTISMSRSVSLIALFSVYRKLIGSNLLTTTYKNKPAKQKVWHLLDINLRHLMITAPPRGERPH
jgi:hypothetical protein